MRTIRIVATALALLAGSGFSSPARAAGNAMLHADNGAVVDSEGAPVQLRCVNLNPWLDPEPYLIGKALRGLTRSPSELKQKLADLVGPAEAQAFWRQWEDTFITRADFARLKQQGFDCVRLPINYKSIVKASPDGAIALDEPGSRQLTRRRMGHGVRHLHDLGPSCRAGRPESGLDRCGHAVQRAVANLWLVPDAPANQKMTVELWRALAARYAKARSVGGYDLLNEPALPSARVKDQLIKLYSAITAAIRSVDPDHMIFSRATITPTISRFLLLRRTRT